MIVVNNKALVVILRSEASAALLVVCTVVDRLIGAGTAVEAGIVVVVRLVSTGGTVLDELIA